MAIRPEEVLHMGEQGLAESTTGFLWDSAVLQPTAKRADALPCAQTPLCAHGSAPSIWKIHAKPRNPSKNQRPSCRTACLPCAYLQARDGNPCPIRTRARTTPSVPAEEVDRSLAPSARTTAGAFQTPDRCAYCAAPLAETVCIPSQPAVEAVSSSRHRPHAFGDQRIRATAPPGR